MKQVPSAEFRKLYTSENEPVEVTSHGKVIGKWYPTGVDIDVPPDVGMQDGGQAEAAPTRFTIRPQLKPRPVMSAEERRLLDPVELRKHEQKRNDEFISRTFGRRKD